jgi:hypothetical protein
MPLQVVPVGAGDAAGDAAGVVADDRSVPGDQRVGPALLLDNNTPARRRGMEKDFEKNGCSLLPQHSLFLYGGHTVLAVSLSGGHYVKHPP